MKFSTREDIEAPAEYVFAQIADFAAFERQALRSGAQITRDDTGAIQAGSSWKVAFKFRGKNRALDAQLETFDPPIGYVIAGVSDGMSLMTDVELVALSPSRTRILVGLDLRARALTAKLILQSMKLAKAKLTKRFRSRVLEFSENIEDSYRKGL